MVYFKKYVLSNPLALSDGRRFVFQSIGNDQGIAALDNQDLINEIRSLAERKIGGVAEITGEEYEDLKKKAEPESRQRPRLTDPAQWQQQQYQLTPRGDLPAVVAAVDPHVIPSPTQQGFAPHTPEPPKSKASADPAANRPVPRKLAKPGAPP